MVKDELFWKNRKDCAKGMWMPNHPHRQLILDELKKIKFDSLLEIGCGSGANLYRIQKEFPNVVLAGIDINEENIAFGRRTVLGASWSVTDAISLPFENKTYDVVLSDAVLIYANPERVETMVNEMKRVAKKAIILCEWHDDALNKFGTLAKGHWVRNYIKLLDGGIATKITNWPKGDKDWNIFGHIIVYEIL